MIRSVARRRGIAVGALALVVATLPALVGRPWWSMAAGIALCLAASAIAVEDMAKMQIPDGLTASVAAVGLAILVLEGRDPIDVAWFVIWAFLTAAALAAFSWAYSWLRGREAIGFGDVKLVGASALLIGPWGVGMQVLLASMAAILFVAIRSIRRGRRPRAAARIPFGSFLAPALVIVWAWFPAIP